MPVSPDDLARTLVRRAAAARAEDERVRETCLRVASTCIARAKREMGFGAAWLIGSLPWGGFGVRSDVDIVIEGLDPERATSLQDAIGEATGRSVDVLSFERLAPAFQKRVLAEGYRVA